MVFGASLNKPHTYRVVLVNTLWMFMYLYIYLRYVHQFGPIGKCKTSSMRLKATHGWLICKKLGEIVLYFTSSSSSPQLTSIQSYYGTMAGYGCNTRWVSSFKVMWRSVSAWPTRDTAGGWEHVLWLYKILICYEYGFLTTIPLYLRHSRLKSVHHNYEQNSRWTMNSDYSACQHNCPFFHFFIINFRKTLGK